MRVLVIEDDDRVAAPLVEGLRLQGYEVTRTASGAEGVSLAELADLVLLDLGLPDLDGYEVCRRIRAASSVPIIAVTARAEEIDRVMGLQLGADDYVIKPYGFRELVARIQAVTRRSPAPLLTPQPAQGPGGHVTAQTAPEPTVEAPSTLDGSAPLEHGSLSLDPRTRRVSAGGRIVALTRKEFDLLAFLLRDPGAVVTRQAILEHVWDTHWFGSSRTLDVHVASLRSKLEDPGLIETVRGVGYRLCERPALHGVGQDDG